MTPSNIRVHILLITSIVVLCGCLDHSSKLPKSINDVKVNVFVADPVLNKSGIPIENNLEQPTLDSIRRVESEGDRTYRLDPPVASEYAYIKSVTWQSGRALVEIESRGGPLTVVENEEKCGERGWFFCKSFYTTSNYTKLSSRDKDYNIERWDAPNTKLSVSSGIIAFEGVPISSLSSFKITGPNWSSGRVDLGISEQESAGLKNLKSDLSSQSKNISLKLMALLANRESANAYATKAVIDELSSYTAKTNDVYAYSTVIANFNDQVIEAAPKVRDIASAYVYAIYSTSLKGTNDTVQIANYLSMDGKKLPHGKFDEILNDAVKIETAKIEQVLKQFDSIGALEKIKISIFSEETIQAKKEKFLRSVYASAIQEKRNNRPIRAMMIYRALIEGKESADSSVAFELQRDQEMRDFLTEQFERLRASNNENNTELIAELRSMSQQLGSAISKVAENTEAHPESRSEEYERNVRMTRDMFYQNRYLNEVTK